MRYGYFDDDRREYVITRPDTPVPWINYLGTDEHFGTVSNTAGGFSWHLDARLRRLSRYRYNNVPTDSGGRYFYINEGGDTWTPTFMPMKKELDFFECRHGLGYTKITGRRNGLRAEVLYFVPLGENHFQPVRKRRVLQLGQLQLGRRADFRSLGTIRSGSCFFERREGSYFEHVHAIG